MLMLLLACNENFLFTKRQEVADSAANDIGTIPTASEPVYLSSASRLFSWQLDSTIRFVAAYNYAGVAPTITDIAASPDGRLFALSPHHLYLVNSSSAELTRVGSTEESYEGLCFNDGGALLATNRREMCALEYEVSSEQVLECSRVTSSPSDFVPDGDCVALPDVLGGQVLWPGLSNKAPNDHRRFMVVDLEANDYSHWTDIEMSFIEGAAIVGDELILLGNDGGMLGVSISNPVSTFEDTSSEQWTGATSNPYLQ